MSARIHPSPAFCRAVERWLVEQHSGTAAHAELCHRGFYAYPEHYWGHWTRKKLEAFAQFIGFTGVPYDEVRR